MQLGTNFPSKLWLAFWSWQALSSWNANAGVIVVAARLQVSTVRTRHGSPLLTENTRPSGDTLRMGALALYLPPWAPLWRKAIPCSLCTVWAWKVSGFGTGTWVSTYLCAWCLWYIRLSHTHLTKFVRITLLPWSQEAERVTFPCLQMIDLSLSDSSLRWEETTPLITFVLWPEKCNSAPGSVPAYHVSSLLLLFFFFLLKCYSPLYKELYLLPNKPPQNVYMGDTAYRVTTMGEAGL